MRKVNIGIVGCGNISQIYIENLSNKFQNTAVVAVCDIDMSRAQASAEKFGIAKVLTFDEMIHDDEVEIIVNLTIPQQHYPLAKQALLAGKHVYLEKPLGLTYDEANELVELAKAQDVLLGCAPDTFLGAGYQTVRKAIDAGLIGDVLSASTFDLNHGHENWHPDPAFFYDIGGGPVFDRGPYNFTCMVSVLGAVRRVAGMTSKAFDTRTITVGPKFGEKIDVKVQTHVSGLLEFESGAICIATMSMDVWGTALPHAEIHGTLGSLIVPDANSFGGDIMYKSHGSDEFQKLPHTHVYAENSRGIGLSDMANAIATGSKTFRTSAELACHVTEIMETLHTSWDKKEFITLQSRCDRPEALPLGLTEGFVTLTIGE